MNRIIIGDVHGAYKTLMALVAKLPKDVPLTFVGDLIDRGPDSQKVVEFVKSGNHDCVRGNHEQMMLDDLRFVRRSGTQVVPSVDLYHSLWAHNGGLSCLDSYEYVDDDYTTLKAHFEWMEKLPLFLEYDLAHPKTKRKLLVSHASIGSAWNTYAPDSEAFKQSCLWDRSLPPKNVPGIYNVFGHTPQSTPLITGAQACIDTGAVLKRKPFGTLTALQFPEMIVYTQENIED